MKILYYNWIHISGKLQGGGVQVYQKNLALAMSELGHDIYYLNSGLTYVKGGGTDVRQRIR